ncbi:putative serine protease K12H4.7 isoform X2 [Ornithodoros turicata]|uniref:putative serine protease K12H4.7 isoform X2 n=1 Tax=Ornithodoros turicata TaxID=34597 RepID=UPI00313994A8
MGRPTDRYGMQGRPETFGRFSDTGFVIPAWFRQRLDHFDPSNMATWKQRYYINKQFYRKGGPVFLMLGGEGEAIRQMLTAGKLMMMTLAEKYGALALLLEHRYYGQSRPTIDLSTENLAYLNSHQALADVAAFRNAMTEEHGLTGKWVVFGGSYAGSLAAWFKLKYPHLAVGAVASSAPLRAVVNFKDYYKIVREALAVSNPECDLQIAKAVNNLLFLVSSPENLQQIRVMFRLCSNLNAEDWKSLAYFFSNLAESIAGVVQYNTLYPTTINSVCHMMTDVNDEKTPLEKFAGVISQILDTWSTSCLDTDYYGLIDTLKEKDFSSTGGAAARQWTYQTCVEFGFFQSSDDPDQPFGPLFPVKYSIKECRDIFGARFDEAMLNNGVQETNTMYGGIHPVLRNVTFPNGSVDPWHALGILEDISADVTAVYINGTSHCVDMNAARQSDPPQLIEARKKIMEQVAIWIGATEARTV